MERDRRILKKMPDRETLEEFLNGFSGSPKVVFNIEKGELEWTTPRDSQLGKPKTPYGRELTKL